MPFVLGNRICRSKGPRSPRKYQPHYFNIEKLFVLAHNQHNITHLIAFHCVLNTVNGLELLVSRNARVGRITFGRVNKPKHQNALGPEIDTNIGRSLLYQGNIFDDWEKVFGFQKWPHRSPPLTNTYTFASHVPSSTEKMS